MPAEGTRVWFVTGATSGFGRAMSQEIVDRGEQLAATGRDQGRVAASFAADGRVLPLGEMAVEHIRAKLERQREQLDSWAEQGAASDFPDASAA